MSLLGNWLSSLVKHGATNDLVSRDQGAPSMEQRTAHRRLRAVERASGTASREQPELRGGSGSGDCEEKRRAGGGRICEQVNIDCN